MYEMELEIWILVLGLGQTRRDVMWNNYIAQGLVHQALEDK